MIDPASDELGCVEAVTITVLAEDSIEFDTPFHGKFGLALLLEIQANGIEQTVLFDTCSSHEPILHNASILGKSLDSIRTIFLSHCHYDHTDGLAGVVPALHQPVTILGHPEIFRPCFEINSDGVRHIGIPVSLRSSVESQGATFRLSRDPVPLMQGVTTLGEIPRVTAFEELEDLYTIENGNVVQDHERDDSGMALLTEEGLVVITGCCHAGIVNTIQHARKVTGVEKVYAVIGGLHLRDASPEKLEKSLEILSEVEWAFVGHCTGFDPMVAISVAKKDRLYPIRTGTVIRIPAAGGEKPISVMPPQERDRHRTV